MDDKNKVFNLFRSMFRELPIDSYVVYIDSLEKNLSLRRVPLAEKTLFLVFKECVRSTTDMYIRIDRERIRDSLNISYTCARNCLNNSNLERFLELRQLLTASLDAWLIAYEIELLWAEKKISTHTILSRDDEMGCFVLN